MAGEFYRQFIPDMELSVERGTDSVPRDGKYHVLKSGRDLGSFRVLKQAQTLFKQVLNESEYQPPPPPEGKSASEMLTDRYLESKDLYWADSHKFLSGGGKGGRGGV